MSKELYRGGLGHVYGGLLEYLTAVTLVRRRVQALGYADTDTTTDASLLPRTP
jgi:hypothetical protein